MPTPQQPSPRCLSRRRSLGLLAAGSLYALGGCAAPSAARSVDRGPVHEAEATGEPLDGPGRTTHESASATRPAADHPPVSAEHPGARPQLDDSLVLRHVAGIRPYRDGAVRLEREDLDGKPVVHAYGHGGCGLTLAWGTAEVAADLLLQGLPPGPVTVLGAGVIGLSVAHELLTRGRREVLIQTRELPPQVTSNVAGGLWMPSTVGMGRSDDEQALFRTVVSRSWERVAAQASSSVPGVSPLRMLDGRTSSSRARSLSQHLPHDVERLERLPLQGRERGGLLYDTWLMEPPVYVAWLLDRVRTLGAHIEQRTLSGPADLVRTPGVGVVCCLGLGAREVCSDQRVRPVRGQLMHLQPQALGYGLSFPGGYMFPRGDALVLGGTFEHGQTSTTPVPADGRAILSRHRAYHS